MMIIIRLYINILETYQPLINKFTQLNIPIIGAINGSAAGVGASFALACDFRVMGYSSSIYYAFINIAIGPDGGGSWLLARQVGYSKALEIATSGKKINGEDCYKLGLTNKLVEDDKILEEAVNWAKELAKKVNDLKNLQVRGDLSFDEFSTMKYLLMYGLKTPYRAIKQNVMRLFIHL